MPPPAEQRATLAEASALIDTGSRMDDFGLELVNEVERAQSKAGRSVPENVERR